MGFSRSDHGRGNQVSSSSGSTRGSLSARTTDAPDRRMPGAATDARVKPEHDVETAEYEVETSDCDGETADCAGETSDCDGETAEYDGETSEYDGETSEYDGETSDCDGVTSDCDMETAEYELETAGPDAALGIAARRITASRWRGSARDRSPCRRSYRR
jgi:hypothetical protein